MKKQLLITTLLAITALSTIGQITFQKLYGLGNISATSVQQTSDSGFIMTGYTTNPSAGQEDVLLIKTNSDGDTLWTRTYGGIGQDEGNYVEQTADGGFI